MDTITTLAFRPDNIEMLLKNGNMFYI